MMFAALLLASLLQTSDDYAQGVVLFEKGQYDASVSKLLRAVKSRPEDARTWKALGVAYAVQSDYSRAVEPLQRACNLDPNLEDSCYFLGRALYALDRFEPSVDVLRRELPRDQHPWRIHLGIAQAFEALGRPTEAEAEFRSAIRSCPQTEDKASVAYARFLFRAGRIDESMSVLRPLLVTLPHSVAGHLEMGRSLYQLDRPAEAIPHLKIACSPQDQWAQACLLLQKAQRLQGSRTTR